ncbi:MAG TPA: ATP-binding protein [Gaiellales bacterium]|nr:ATP-binding protein [Gaiellales bacterium]
MSVHEIVLDVLLAVALGVLGALALRARGSRQRAERNVEAERALREQLSAQADALDRLLAATTGLADELDEGRLLERIAEEAVELVSAECGLVLERTDNRCTVVTSAPLGQAWRPAALDAGSATDLAAALAQAYGGAVEVTPLPVPSLQGGALAVLRSAERPFSAVERAQLRVFAAAAVRTAHNARLFTLAETLRVEAELRERERGRLSDRLLRVEEGERRRLALALHDGPQQSIAGIGLIVQAAHDTIKAGEVEQGLTSLNRALEHCRGVVRSLRTLTFALEPITLRDHGFTAAFCELAGQLSESHKVEIVVDATAIDALDRQAQVSLYRIAQEATTNAVKHAGGSRIDVTARTLEKGGIELCIADNGCGAHEDELQRGGMHRGVDAMRERAWGVGGTMTFEETTGGGCTVRVIVPPRPAVEGHTPATGRLRAA